MENIWQAAQDNIEKVLTPQTFTTWIKPIRFSHINNNQFILQVPNKFIKDWVREKYFSMIQEAVNSLAERQYQLEILISDHDSNEATPVEPKPARKAKEPVPAAEAEIASNLNGNLNPKYTFDTFVCGSSNQFAYAASQAVAAKPATNYNPLFIYGGVGLGKTHLLIAIGNEILKNKPKARICYYTSEKFMNEMINSLRYKKMEEFRNKFRKADLLLIDDIQFMQGKEATQEEFFHTFNSLYESHKQIILTSDKFPREIPGLEERLRSRFEWGLIADIQPPDVETKIAILKKKAELNGIELPDDVALFIGSSASSNIRELEGMLVRLGAYASLTRNKISLNMARDILKDIIVDKSKEITIEMIQKHVADHYKLKISDLKSEKRLKALVVPRQIAIYLCRDMTKASYPEIGEKFGGKDHSTIIHSVKKIDGLLAADPALTETLRMLKHDLLN
ncbi:chromosomal replication initiator protein DnaA [Geobacter argillaceus]|uniref:Chromosomal replication initiator protein DnaA n=1 Tax=Geobacter argillaceus TaxID=345631 RepID=A0A562VP53_9BACT|nr:chromosomal replication initiator protein DnaA [Geobacter argillaceus]TWJ19517.1 chromosomal replication initiator protein DnaA [Geobacter argillaceus]